MIPKIVTQFLFAVLYCTMFLEVLYIIRIHSLHKQKGEPMSTVKTVYPEWVRKYREKGYSIKKSGERYYLYRHSSRRVEGKKYPQAKDTYVGVITPDGIIYAKNKRRCFLHVLTHGKRLFLPTGKTFSSGQSSDTLKTLTSLTIVPSTTTPLQ